METTLSARGGLMKRGQQHGEGGHNKTAARRRYNNYAARDYIQTPTEAKTIQSYDFQYEYQILQDPRLCKFACNGGPIYLPQNLKPQFEHKIKHNSLFKY